MKHIYDFETYEQMNETLKGWISTFLILAGLGLVPASIAQNQDRNLQKEFVENLDQTKVDAALFVDYLNRLEISGVSNLDSQFRKFKLENPKVESDFSDVEKYVNRSGKQFLFNQKYIHHDYSGVDITKFTPDNWLTDMANMIEDSKEPTINNWISDYEKTTGVEIGIITIDHLPEDVSVEEYALSQFRRLGVGKRGSNNGVLIVLSKGDRKWNITTGYGIEGLLPDVTCSQIGRNKIVPNFKKGDYYTGVIEALEGIKSIVGTKNIEDTKYWLQKQKESQEKANKETLDKVLELAFLSLIILLSVGLISWGVYKKRKKVKELRELKENIDKIISSIESLKKSLGSAPTINSKTLDSFYKRCKDYFDSVKIDQEISQDSQKKLMEVYLNMKKSLELYRSKQDEISKLTTKIKSLDRTQKEIFDAIESAAISAKSIMNYGYQPKSELPSKEEADKLAKMIPQILLLVSNDIDSAFRLYNTYLHKSDEVKRKSSEITHTLRDIEKAISRLKNWPSEITRLKTDFIKADGDVSELSKKVELLINIQQSGADPLKITFELDKIISFMKYKIEEYENKERRKREEEERRRRQEEDETRRRNSYYSTSSSSWGSSDSSSSSSFGGFGGGDSGGGGASGDW